MDFTYLENVAIEAALSAGDIIKEHIRNDIKVEQKKGGESYASQVVTEVDRACEKAILANLLPTCEQFDIALLSEETEDDGSRFKKDFFWCIDPMDGTLAFINKKPGFSVSIALVAKDGTPHIGVVFNPSTNTIYSAIKGNGAYKDGELLEIGWANNDYLTYVTDEKLSDSPHADKIKELLNEKIAESGLHGMKEIHGAGSVLNAIFVLENRPAYMFKFPKKEKGGGSLWDFAATACIYNELDLRATNFEGGRLDLNKKDGSFMNDEGIFYTSLIPSPWK